MQFTPLVIHIRDDFALAASWMPQSGGMIHQHLIARLLGAILLRAVLLGALLLGAVGYGVGVSGPAAVSDAGTARWQPPIETPLRVSGPFRAPPTPYASGHRGIDLPAVPGNAIMAPAAGTVSFAGRVVDRSVLSIRVDARTVVTMEPIDAETLELSEGDAVVRGQLVGSVGSGGHCDSECLHLGVRVDGEYVNPMRYFSAKPVLLPW